jgi:hypothetical protein
MRTTITFAVSNVIDSFESAAAAADRRFFHKARVRYGRTIDRLINFLVMIDGVIVFELMAGELPPRVQRDVLHVMPSGAFLNWCRRGLLRCSVELRRSFSTCFGQQLRFRVASVAGHASTWRRLVATTLVS